MATVIGGQSNVPWGAAASIIQLLAGIRQQSQENAQREAYAKAVNDALSGRKTSVTEKQSYKGKKPSGWKWDSKTNQPVPSGEENWQTTVPIERTLTPEEQAAEDKRLQLQLEGLGAMVLRQDRIDTSKIFPTQKRSGLSIEEQIKLREVERPSQRKLNIEKEKASKTERSIKFQKLMNNYINNPSTENRIALSSAGKELDYTLEFTPKQAWYKNVFSDAPPAVIARDKSGKIVGIEKAQVKEKKKLTLDDFEK